MKATGPFPRKTRTLLCVTFGRYSQEIHQHRLAPSLSLSPGIPTAGLEQGPVPEPGSRVQGKAPSRRPSRGPPHPISCLLQARPPHPIAPSPDVVPGHLEFRSGFTDHLPGSGEALPAPLPERPALGSPRMCAGGLGS